MTTQELSTNDKISLKKRWISEFLKLKWIQDVPCELIFNYYRPHRSRLQGHEDSSTVSIIMRGQVPDFKGFPALEDFYERFYSSKESFVIMGKPESYKDRLSISLDPKSRYRFEFEVSSMNPMLVSRFIGKYKPEMMIDQASLGMYEIMKTIAVSKLKTRAEVGDK